MCAAGEKRDNTRDIFGGDEASGGGIGNSLVNKGGVNSGSGEVLEGVGQHHTGGDTVDDHVFRGQFDRQIVEQRSPSNPSLWVFVPSPSGCSLRRHC